MLQVTFIEHDGTPHLVSAPPERTLMQIALDNGVPGILGDCGGSCSCATCHAYVDARWADKLPPTSETETFMLEGVPDPRENSRLCCQIKMQAALDGIVVQLPEVQV
ncbi:2Fe-2S iron-sulfur cluster-binding protein [Variovorax sp. J31P207]|uniref:2Fe-2S iron-sulfur cluster-binding protein n=1 Tax=Variovorax sp. J31P207 TaxID=3053510 RepID=UPI002578BD99|nr:2Fe-2S iron-sulfur cluster-binding protein [Variovorax sp. J31P207]MDM0067025.1 2Fe-2S iron-sulfur cluster-binding protein [Variovorax sp. J31P207]